MGYEEVETVLPADFVPQPDPVPETEDAAIEQLPAEAEASEADSEVEDGRGAKKKRSSRSIMRRWKSSRSKSRSRSKEMSAEAKDAKAKEETKSRSSSKSRSKLWRIRKVDSNATDTTKIRSNTTKSKKEEDARQPEETTKADGEDAMASLPTVREGSPANATISTEGTGENSAGEADVDTAAPSPSPAPSSATGISIEIGDENEQHVVEVHSPLKEEEDEADAKEEEQATTLQTAPSKDASVRSTKSNKSNRSTKSSRSIKSKKSGETNKAADSEKIISDDASVKSTTSNKSSRSTSSKRSLKSRLLKSKSKEEIGGEEDKTEGASTDGECGDKESEALANEEDAPQAKWVKKVSLSIGGYNTSFQLSDPMANLKEAVDDALNVVDNNDANLAAQARELDNIYGDDESVSEEERDYDENPTRLFMYLQQRAWGLALSQLQEHPDEAKVWVYRKAKPEKAPNVPDADKKEGAMVVQHTAIVPHDGSEIPKFRWKLLPLHAAIVLGAPTEIVQHVIRAYHGAAKKTDERGSLPVHLAASRLDVDPEGEKVVLQLFGAFPDSIEMKDRKGRTPPELAKLARARKEVEEERKVVAGSQENVNQKSGEDGEGEDGGDGGDDDDDDDCSVKSSLSGRFQQMLRKSKSTDTVDRRKKSKKKGKKSPIKENLGLSGAKSMDAHDDGEPVDDASIKASLGPGFAFLKTSKSQEVRESTASDKDKSKEGDEANEEQLLVAVKKAIVGDEYQMPEHAPRDIASPSSIPLPMSFSMNDDGMLVRGNAVFDDEDDGDDKTTMSIKTTAASVISPKSVKISDEHQVHEVASPATADEMNEVSSGSDEESGVTINEGLRALLEKAVENAGRGGMDVTEFVKVLEDEWVTDVEALRRLDGETLDDLLPLMLSRELQRLINHADSIDSKFLKDDEQGRGRSPKKTKKKKKKRSSRKVKKRSTHRPVTPPNGPLTTISEAEEGDTPGSTASNDALSIVTEARSVYLARLAPPKLEDKVVEDAPATMTLDGSKEEAAAKTPDGSEEEEEEVNGDVDINQSASIEDLEIRRLHANLIADARMKFPTREALEDSIRERQAEVSAAVNSGFDVDKQVLARAALADDEVRKLLPLRLILPTVGDLTEMIGVLQLHKESAMRSLDMEKARGIQVEIDELQDQIDKEERYILKKRIGETRCRSCGKNFPTEVKQSGILKTKEKKCEECRAVEATSSAVLEVETVDSRDDAEK